MATLTRKSSAKAHKPFANYSHVVRGRACKFDGPLQQRLASELQKGLIASHTRAFAAGKHKSRNSFHLHMIRLRLWMQVSVPQVHLALAL